MEDKWKFHSVVAYAGEYFIIDLKPLNTKTAGVYLQSRTTKVTREEAKEAEKNAVQYYSSWGNE